MGFENRKLLNLKNSCETKGSDKQNAINTLTRANLFSTLLPESFSPETSLASLVKLCAARQEEKMSKNDFI